MTAFNAVRFRVKPARDQEFLDAHKKIEANWPGLVHVNVIKTGDHTYCIIAEWTDMDALAKARTYLAGLFPLGLESHEALAEQISDSLLDGVGLNHLLAYRTRIGAVTADAARAAARDLSPARDGAQIVVVGDGESSRKALSGLCPVEVRPIEEVA